MAFSPARLLPTLQHLLQQCQPHSTRLWLAFSGGLDSTVLLHALAALRGQLPAYELGAIHIHHGLQDEADAWLAHCHNQCERLGIEMLAEQVKVNLDNGASPEDAARQARYRALAGCMAKGDILLTAQHADDQAETLLLQLLRGAGPRGLAAMPAATRFARGWQVRPLLGVSRESLSCWAQAAGLDWIEDPSNLDSRFDRNFLRQAVLPTLKTRWPALNSVLGRVARQQAEAAELLDALAGLDLQVVQGAAADRLLVSQLLQLPDSRQRNVLRLWLRLQGMPLPSRRKLDAVCRETLRAGPDRQPRVGWPGVELRRYRDELFAMSSLPTQPAAEWCFDWDLQQPLLLPAGLGSLHVAASQGRGLSRQAVQAGVRIGFRRGGESCQPAGQRHHRSLKKLFQEAAVAPWQRRQTPLVFVGEQLAEIIGLCVCEPFQAQPDEAAVQIIWQRNGASA